LGNAADNEQVQMFGFFSHPATTDMLTMIALLFSVNKNLCCELKKQGYKAL